MIANYSISECYRHISSDSYVVVFVCFPQAVTISGCDEWKRVGTISTTLSISEDIRYGKFVLL